MTVSVLTSHVFGPAKLIFNAGGVGPAKFNIRTDPFAKYMHIYIYVYIYIYRILSYYPHPPYTPPHSPQPHVLGGAGRGGWGTWGWGGGVGHWGGWGMRRTSCIYRYIHTCWYQDYGGEKSKILGFHLRFNRFGKKYRQIECQAGVQSIKYVPD